MVVRETRLLKWLLIPLAIVSVLTLARDGGGITLQDYLSTVVKLLDSTLGVVLETIFREPIEWFIARINEAFQLNLFLQDHWKPAFFLLWIVFNNYVLATWNAATGWPRLVLALVCALGGGVMAATVNLAHISVFIWPASFAFLFLAGAVATGWISRVVFLVVAGLGAAWAMSLGPILLFAAGTSPSMGLLLLTIGVFVTGLVFLVRGVAGHDSANGGWWNNPGRQMGGYVLLVLLGALAVLGLGNWTGQLFRTAETEVIADTPYLVVRDCKEGCPEMISVPAGTFDMGANDAETSYAANLGAKLQKIQNERPIHKVNVGRFWLSKTEVTRGQYQAFVDDTGYRPGRFCFGVDQKGEYASLARNDWRNHPGIEQESEEHPVVCVTWHDAQAYVKWLSLKTGKKYRLPSESEWEYAARAGTTTSRYWGQDNKLACDHANVADQQAASSIEWIASNDKEIFPCRDGYVFTAPVARFKPNNFGLYDMLGNVWEWTDDFYNNSYLGAPVDGSSWRAARNVQKRVVRGGGGSDVPYDVRAAKRYDFDPGFKMDAVGFRVARTD